MIPLPFFFFDEDLGEDLADLGDDDADDLPLVVGNSLEVESLLFGDGDGELEEDFISRENETLTLCFDSSSAASISSTVQTFSLVTECW